MAASSARAAAAAAAVAAAEAWRRLAPASGHSAGAYTR